MSSVTNRQPVRKFFAIAFVIVAVASKARAQSQWEKIVEAANREGEVSLYGSDDFESLFREFHKKYPKIAVKGYFGRGRDAALRIVSERRADKYLADLYVNGMTTAYSMLYKGKAVDPIADALVLPEVVDRSKWWRGQHHYVDPEQKYLLIFNGQARVDIAYNTKLVDPRQIKSYWDLLNPKWKGKIVSMDPTVGAAGTAMRFVFYHPELGPEYLKKILTETDAIISQDSRQMADWLAAGKVAFAIFNGISRMELGTAKQQGLPVDWFGPEDLKEGASITASSGGIALMNRAPHPNAAKVAINWLLSREGQMLFQKLFAVGEEGPDSLRIDISKNDVPRTSRRFDGDEQRFPQTDTPKWMDMTPVIKFVKGLKK